MNKAVIYARYSSDSQTEQSIEGQMRVCKEFAEKNGYVIVGEYVDRAMTGTNDKRPAFQQMIWDSKKHEWSFVLVYNFEDVKNFISLFASKDYDDVFERNEFFNRFIKKVLLFNDKIIVIMRGSKSADNEFAINNDELYAKRILEKFEKKETSENNFENKNGSFDNSGSHFCENYKILKEKEVELDLFVHLPPRGGSSNSQFEPFVKISQVEHENEKVEPEIGKTETANENVETQNKKRGRPKAKNKTTPPTIQKFSNHIKFIDYIPTHELITYRHLFAYGFYVE